MTLVDFLTKHHAKKIALYLEGNRLVDGKENAVLEICKYLHTLSGDKGLSVYVDIPAATEAEEKIKCIRHGYDIGPHLSDPWSGDVILQFDENGGLKGRLKDTSLFYTLTY